MQAKGGFAVPRLSHGAELFAWGGEHKHAVKRPDRIKRSKASERLWLHSKSQRNTLFLRGALFEGPPAQPGFEIKSQCVVMVLAL